MPFPSPYSTVDDLLLGDLLISNKIDKGKFVQDAADEMDSKLGFIYVLPLEPRSPLTEAPVHEALLLKNINNKLASGRLLLTLDIAGEGTTLHSYGLRLVTEALNDLMQIANGMVTLSFDRQEPSAGVRPEKTPKCVNRDEESAVEMFESAVMRRGDNAYWQPGAVGSRFPVRVDPWSGESGTVWGGG